MENPLFDVKVLVPTIIALVMLIGWFIRLETRATQGYEAVKKVHEALEHHKENTSIHFNRDVNRQVDEKNEIRFKKIDSELVEIKADVKELLRKR